MAIDHSVIKKTLAMKRWAVVGASDDPARYGYRIYQVLKDRGFKVWPIHPRLKDIEGDLVYTSIAELPEKPEVIDMVVNPNTGIKVMAQIAAAGIKYVWMQPGTRSEEIRVFAKENGITLIEDCVLVRVDQ